MPIPNAFLQLPIYLYPTTESAHQSTRTGGTGFVVAGGDDGGGPFYVVTNAHVIEGFCSQAGETVVLRFNKKDATLGTYTTNIDAWVTHPSGDDLAICPITIESQWAVSTLRRSQLIKETYIQDMFSSDMAPKVSANYRVHQGVAYWDEIHKVGIGDSTITIGRYAPHAGTRLNLPAVRHGHLSMLPVEPVSQPRRNRYLQDSFIIESQSSSGLSGSPATVQTGIDHHTKSTTGPTVRPDQIVMLLGVDWGHFDEKGEIADMPATDVTFPSGMMCVVPAWKLEELIVHIETGVATQA